MKRWSWTLCAVLFAGACTQDSPTEAGSGLLPPDAIRTFEFVLEPERYLVWDTAFGLYSETSDAAFALLANEYEGVLNSRALVRYQIPRVITLTDTAGVLRNDSTPAFFEGHVRVVVDTLASTPPSAVLNLFHTTESWDRESATWTFRVDSAGVQLPWTQPGGSPGALIGTATYEQGDTVFIPVDSATIALWADTTNAARGAVLGVATAGARLRTELPTLRLRARSTLNPDTIVEVNVSPGRTFIFEPELAEVSAAPRVGGTPDWRTFLQVRERLDTVSIPCPGEPGCMIDLSDVTVNFAAMQWEPQPSPTGFGPELPTTVSLHAVLPSPLLPLERSPVSQAFGISGSIPVSSFTTAGAPVVELAATDFVRLLFAPPDTAEFVPSHLALLSAGALRTFGFASFAEMPSMRIIVTVSRELQLP